MESSKGRKPSEEDPGSAHASDDESSLASGEEKSAPSISSTYVDLAAKLEISHQDLGLSASASTPPPRPEHPPSDPYLAVMRVGPRAYEIINFPDEDVRFAALGCIGSENLADQQAVADHLRQTITQDPANKPHFVFLLGDLGYPIGFDSITDERLESKIRKMYDFGVPIVIAEGNHDQKRHKIGKHTTDATYAAAQATGIAGFSSLLGGTPKKNKDAIGWKRSIHLSAYNYAPHKADTQIGLISKEEFFSQEKLDYKSLPQYFKPYFYFTFWVRNLQFYILDSNVYLDHYLTLLEKGEDGVDPHDNMALWLRQQFAETTRAGREAISLQHNPHHNNSKQARYGKGDAFLFFIDENGFLSEERWRHLAARLGHDAADYQYEKAYVEVLKREGIHFTANFSAHRHALTNHISPFVREFGTGAGSRGDDLHHRAIFDDVENMGFYLRHLGYVIGSCNIDHPSRVNVHAYTLAGHHLLFNNLSPLPITRIADSNTAKLRQAVMNACRVYNALLNEQVKAADLYNKEQLQASGLAYLVARAKTAYFEPKLLDVDMMHDIVALLSRKTLGDFKTTLRELHELIFGKDKHGKELISQRNTLDFRYRVLPEVPPGDSKSEKEAFPPIFAKLSPEATPVKAIELLEPKSLYGLIDLYVRQKFGKSFADLLISEHALESKSEESKAVVAFSHSK